MIINSKSVAEKFNKRHDHLLRDIRKLVSRDERQSENFIKTIYYNRGKEYPAYEINKKGLKILESKYQYRIHSPRLEYTFEVWLDNLLLGVEIEKQKWIGKYRVDFYLPEHNIVIEYDEYEHKYKQEYDVNRKNYILNYLSNINNETKFIVVKEGKEVEGIRKVLINLCGDKTYLQSKVS